MPTIFRPNSITGRIALGLLTGLWLGMPSAHGVDVLTFHNDNTHSGTNAAETALNQGNVNATQFGVVATIPVVGDVFAQPLYVSNVPIPGQGNKNVVIIATENNYVYCVDADNYTVYWTRSNLGNPMLRSVVTGDTNYDVNIGITSTPVIDATSKSTGNGLIYCCTLTTDSPGVYNYRVWALNLSTGVNQVAPVVVAPTATTFTVTQQGQRPALTLANGNVYVSFASFSDQVPYAGFVIAYNASTLAQAAQFVAGPSCVGAGNNGQCGGGIWMSGCGPAVDASGNLFLVTGNGTSDVTITGTPPLSFPAGTYNFGEAIIKFSPNLTVLDYYSPSYRVNLNNGDADLGVGGLTLLPQSGGPTVNAVVHGSKEGKLYVENRDNLGQFNAASDAVIQANNWFNGSLVKATPVYWTDHNGILRVIGAAESNNSIKSFTVASNGTLNTPPSVTSTNLDASTNVSLTQMALSCNGATAGSGILWLMSPTVADPIHQFGPGILRAYNADTLVELYNSTQNPQRDSLGYWPKNCAPLVANGKVYAASLSNMVYVYGLVPVTVGLTATITSPQNNSTTAIEPATITINVVATSSTTTVTKVDFFSGITQIGEVTAANAPYTISWTPVYGGTYTITALVTDNLGATAMSAPVTVTVPGHGSGTIELEAYTGNSGTGISGSGPNPTSVLTADPSYPNSPNGTMNSVSVFPPISFPTVASGPNNTGVSNYGNRLIGYVYPPITGSYYFWIASDDSSNLYLSSDATPGNQVLIASVGSWTNYQSWTTFPSQQSALIPLVAGRRYFIQAYHQQGGGGDNFDVGWQIPDGPGGMPGTLERPINGEHLSPPTLAPLVAPRAASYSGPITVTMANALPIPGETIYYTTDGHTTPTTASTPYTGPFVVSTTTTIMAVTVLTDGTGSTPAAAGAPVGTIVSPVATNVYTISGSTAYGLASLAPTGANAMPASLVSNPPAHLSGTGLFSNSTAAGLTPAAGILPYNVIAPLWSDNATKSRWVALPAGRQITFAATGEFTFPAGTVMIKNFVLNGVPLELRLLVLTGPNAGYGVTYKWEAGGADADLMGPGSPSGLSDGLDETESGGQVWHYPARAECLQCHTGVANFVLGPKTRQLNTTFAYPGGATDNELRTWNYLQMFTSDIGEGNIAGFTKLTNISDTSAGTTLQDRVRSYVDANCAQCHRPGGVDTYWDARFDTALANQGIVDGVVKSTLGIIGAEVVRPQSISESVMELRMNSVDPTIKMPPLARNVIDANAVSVLDAWIGTLPPSSTTVPVQPSGLIATVVSSTEIDLSWTNNANNQTGFVIQAMTGTTGSFTQIAAVPGSTFTFNNTGLSAGTQYSFQVAATNGAGPSTFSNVATATTSGAAGPGGTTAAASSSGGGGGHCGFGAAAAGLLLLIWAMRRQLMS